MSLPCHPEEIEEVLCWCVWRMGRTPCCDREAVKRGPWSPEEDDALRDYINRHGTAGNWISLPNKAGQSMSSHHPA